MELNTPMYTAHKDKIMEECIKNFSFDLKSKLDSMRYKYANNSRVFDTDLDYVKFCRSQIRASVLTMMAFDLELESN